ncbi:MAG: hypothetical protein OEQ39_00270 [Gammaproteobacteria bacterium]|nr:hypothetical protein [Gammaproteobacteria bacterium]
MARARKATELAVAQEKMPAFMDSDSKRGQEGVGVEDLTIPRLQLIQDLSPQRKKNDPQYIEGAEEGMMFNSVTKALYGEQVIFIPCFYKKEWVIWKSQSEGGGFLGAFTSQTEANREFRDQGLDGQVDKKGNPIYEINDTGQQFGLIVDPDGHAEDIVLSLSKTKRKVDRQLNTIIKMAGGDRFSRMYKIRAVQDENAAGQNYYNFGVELLGFVSDEALYRRAEALYEAIASGERDVNRDEV